ncbi:MAG: hypothetical protein HBSAPP02_14960 [Phycisphaerae bacterium]|nr:MAG: response regulator [Planctomycetia bacterium]GJQ26464.1 MAG: hypothetical protein HBSAPP02_14960 [Phycisphaerae bacterium]
MDVSRVLDVGNCDPDHGMIRGMLERNFRVAIDRVMFVDEAIEKMRSNQYDLVLFNRLIFEDGSEGIDLLHRAKSDPAVKRAPMMMISNFEKAQAKSVAAGGVMGFGKAVVDSPGTVALLSQYLLRKA